MSPNAQLPGHGFVRYSDGSIALTHGPFCERCREMAKGADKRERLRLVEPRASLDIEDDDPHLETREHIANIEHGGVLTCVRCGSTFPDLESWEFHRRSNAVEPPQPSPQTERDK